MRNTRYLVQIGGRWYCRIRWPKSVWGTLGSGSFKKSLNTDSRDEAVMRLAGVMQQYWAAVAQAKGRQLEGKPRALGDGEIALVVAEWFREAQNAFKVDARPKQFEAGEVQARRQRLQQLEQKVAAQRERLGMGDYTTLYPIVDGVLERAGINADRDDPSFGVLCRTLMRAWIAMEERAVAHMRGEFGFQPADPVLAELEAAAPCARTAQPRTLGDLITQFSAEKTATWSKSTVNAYRPIFRLLRDALGENRAVASIDRATAREVFELVKHLPKSLGKNKELAALPVPAAVAAAKELGLPTLSAKSINDGYMALIVAPFSWAMKEQWIVSNPFRGLSVVDDVAPEDKRNPFTSDQLATIFGGAPWSTRDTEPGGKPSLYWAPLMCLYHGLRVGEPCGMLLEEIIEINGVPTMYVTPNRLRRLKNKPSRRHLPIHPELIRLGFLDFVKAQRAAGHNQLFPEATEDASGHYGDHVTDWFIRLIKAHNMDGQKLATHSLRHSFADALREAGIDGTPRAAVLAGRQSQDVTEKSYGSGHRMRRLLESLEIMGNPIPCPPGP